VVPKHKCGNDIAKSSESDPAMENTFSPLLKRYANF
jgi:hypothetical protein